MRFNIRTLAVFASSMVVFCLCLPVFADPPARIGRLNYLSGSVSFRPGDVDDWTPAIINVPMKTGDHLWTDANSRAEVHAGSTAIRLAPNTAFAFLNIDDQTTQIRLTQGVLNVRLLQLSDSEVFEIDTPNTAVSLLRPGSYRINVDELGNTIVTDRLGEAEVTAMGSAFTVHPRETATISGTGIPTYDVRAALLPDDWDDWCSARDRREEQAVSVRYVSREMVGYEDLDEYGVWRPVPEYGVVWVPSRVPAAWAPYRFGHWMWVEPWGWTWVDDMQWGFAPFHYGRWALVGGTWVWVPGRPVARPVYAPALVAFVGGSNWHVSLSIGSGVAWFPLGPREAYVPAYHASPTYVRNINVTHVNVTNINVTNVNVVNTTYVNRTVPGAVTAVPQAAFVKAQPVAKAAVVVPQQVIATAPVSGTTATVAPQRESLTGKSTAGPIAVAHPPERAMNRTVVARNTPPPPPIPFVARQSELAANPGRPVDPEKIGSLRKTAPSTAPLVKPAGVPAAPRPAAPSVANETERPGPKPVPAQNDRPNRPVQPRVTEERPAPPHPPETHAKQERPAPAPKPEADKPRHPKEKGKEKPEEGRKSKEEDRHRVE